MKKIFFVWIIYICTSQCLVAQKADTTQASTTNNIKVSHRVARPARHFLGARSGLGINTLGNRPSLANFALDYDIVFRNSPIGLSFTAWGESIKGANAGFNLGGSAGLLFYIPYSKQSDITSGFAIKTKLDVFANSLTLNEHSTQFTGSYSIDHYDPFPVIFTEYVSKYEDIHISGGLGVGAALNLGLESRFQLAKNLFISCGLETKAGAITGTLIGYRQGYEIHSYKNNISQTSSYNTAYAFPYTLPYVSFQLQTGVGFVFRGKIKQR